QVAQLLDQPIPDGVDDATRAQLEEQRASLEAIRPMLEKAAENAPRIPPLAASAVERLEAAAYAEAKPPEEEIRRLLEEIRALVPPPPEQPEQPDPSDQEEEQDSKSEDSEKQDEPQDGEQERPENPPDDGDPKDASEPPPAPDPGEPPPDGKSPQDPRQLSPQQVEALLKRALDREKELKEKEKALERILAVPVPVEKDW